MSDYVRVVSPDEPLPSMPAEPALKTKYDPDRFQKFAIQGIEAGENILVTAKTGSGKTFVGEYQIAKSLQRGGRIFYTTPIKSLSNQKFHDLKQLFPDASVGIMTGDIKFRPDAQIIVMTTEILRNLLFKRGTATESVGATALVSLNDLDAVIFDEVHYINDQDRGHVWEETLILLPPSIKLILLSATLSSPYGFAKWLGESKKVRVWLISTLWRAVPLEHCVIDSTSGKPLVIYDAKEQYHDGVYRAWIAGKDATLLAHDKFKDKVRGARLSGHEGPVSGKVRPKAFEHQMNECLQYLQSHGNLPAIFFVFSRVGCEKLAGKVQGEFLDSSDSALVAHVWDFHLSRYKDSLEKSPQYHRLRELAMRGIAFHHSGLLPFMKEILEVLFTKCLIKVLFATETFAVGINMPTKTVVFTALDKYSDGGNRSLMSSEYIQMAGRAGRRGKDDRGLVLYLPQRDPVDPSILRQILTGRAATFGSRMNFHYDFVLKVANQESSASPASPAEAEAAEANASVAAQAAPLRALIENSYWWVLQDSDVKCLEKQISELEQVILDKKAILREEEVEAYRVKVALEEKIQSSQNSKKKAAQRELEIWKADHRESTWNPILARVSHWESSCKELETLVATRASALREINVPSIRRRLSVLEEFGYVNNEGRLTGKGRLASEINEGHPFLSTELFLRMQGNSKSWNLQDLLTVLAVFLGELGDSDDVTKNKHPSELNVSAAIRDELLRVGDDAKLGCKRESAANLVVDVGYWSLSTEWVEPIAAWVLGDEILPVVAAEFEIFEGNLQRALMKLMGLVDEFRALATLAGNTGWLEVLEGAQAVVLRDVVVAESLYLRL